MFPVITSSAQWKEVRDKIDIVRVAHSLFGEPEKENGDKLYWFCPFHGGAEPTLQITSGRYQWRCLGCDQRGDAVDLVRCKKEFTFSKALAFLSDQKFYTDEPEIHTESVVPEEAQSEKEVNNNWIDDLIQGV